MMSPGAQNDRSRNIGAYSTRTIRWLTVLGMAVALSMLVLGGVVLLDARDDARRESERASDNLALALSRDIGRNIAVFDLSVQGTIDALRLPGIGDVSSELRQTALFDRSATAEYLGSILVLDTKGVIAADSTAPDPHRLDLSDRDYFTVHVEKPDVGLFVSRPYRSRLRNGDASIAISRRLTGPDGRFAGVVMGALRTAYFRALFSTLNLGPHGAVTLFRNDGILLARYPEGTDDEVGRDLRQAPIFRQFAGPNGRVVGVSAVDGVTRTFNYRQIDDFPLVLSIGTGLQDIYAAWWRKALTIGSVLVVLCTATVGLCLLFRREMLRRLRAEDALLEAAEKLSVIASTDSLTGVANRRSFEAELKHEWRRAIRTETELSLLMLDADWFKPFNDQYGHQDGDRVLQAIAAAIERSIRRPGDLGARYGGEEFMALLPETDLAGAAIIAERIRATVSALAIPHIGSALGHVTISIGVASARPCQGSDEATLVKEADDTLYEAKRAGRNRVVVAGQETVSLYPTAAGIGATPPASIAAPADSNRSSR